jgi:hypothetical protein
VKIPLYKKLTPVLNIILVQELLFLIGAYTATKLGWIFHEKTLIIMVVTILPLLIIALLFVGAYKIVIAFINSFFKEVSPVQKTLLTVGGLISLLTGFLTVL